MTVSVASGTFTKDSSGTNGVDQSIALSFAPKAIWLRCVGRTSAGWGTHCIFAVGMSDGTDDFSACAHSQDAANPSLCRRRHAAKVITILDTSGVLTCEASLKDWTDGAGGNGATFTWDTNDTNAFIIEYFAVGGDDITDVKLVQFDGPTSTGNQAITGVGFAPDMYFLLSAQDSASVPSTSATAGLAMGMAIGVNDEGTLAGSAADNKSTTETGTHGGGDPGGIVDHGAYVNSIQTKGTPTTDGIAQHVSMDSDGFTMNWTQAPASARKMAALCIEGGAWDIHQYTAPSSNGNQAYTDPGFEPRGVMFFSKASGNEGVKSNLNLMMGWASGAGVESCSWAGDVDGKTTGSEADRHLSTTKAISMALAGSPTTPREAADLASFDATGYTLGWTTTLSTGRSLFWHLAVGDTPAASASRRAALAQVV